MYDRVAETGTWWEGKANYVTFPFICITGFNIEDLINVAPLKGGKQVKVA